MTPDQTSAITAELRGLSRRFDEHAKRTESDLTEIKVEVKKTNGRVTSLEAQNAKEANREAGRKEGIHYTIGWASHPLFVAVVASVISVLLALVVTGIA